MADASSEYTIDPRLYQPTSSVSLPELTRVDLRQCVWTRLPESVTQRIGPSAANENDAAGAPRHAPLPYLGPRTVTFNDNKRLVLACQRASKVTSQAVLHGKVGRPTEVYSLMSLAARALGDHVTPADLQKLPVSLHEFVQMYTSQNRQLGVFNPVLLWDGAGGLKSVTHVLAIGLPDGRTEWALHGVDIVWFDSTTAYNEVDYWEHSCRERSWNNADGLLLSDTTYVHGQRHGLSLMCEHHMFSDTFYIERRFVNEAQHGMTREWCARTGRLLCELTFVNGRPHGRQLLWDKTGRVAYVSHQYEGKMHGETVSFTRDGRGTRRRWHHDQLMSEIAINTPIIHNAPVWHELADACKRAQ